MTTIGMTQGRGLAMAQSSRSGSIVRKALLAGGILSSLLYIATDVLGGLRYDGYSFASQAISELGAIGAPSKPFVDPLFIAYHLLALVFGIGILRGGNRPTPRLMGRVSQCWWLRRDWPCDRLSLAGPDLFAMHQRGTGSLAADAPHMILTAVLVLLLLLAMGFGAFAFGKRFRLYSFATLLTLHRVSAR